jgi:hypothetical protein
MDADKLWQLEGGDRCPGRMLGGKWMANKRRCALAGNYSAGWHWPVEMDSVRASGRKCGRKSSDRRGRTDRAKATESHAAGGHGSEFTPVARNRRKMEPTRGRAAQTQLPLQSAPNLDCCRSHPQSPAHSRNPNNSQP